MGSSLIINERETNDKKGSGILIDLLRLVYPKKKSLQEDTFAVSLEEVAHVLHLVTHLTGYDANLNQFMKNFPDIFDSEDTFEKNKETILKVENYLARVLAQMVIEKKCNIILEWV